MNKCASFLCNFLEGENKLGGLYCTFLLLKILAHYQIIWVNNEFNFRITRSLKMHIYNLRWLAKLNFDPDVGFEFRELRQFGKFLTDLPGVKCAWVHPRHVDKEPVHLS